MSHHIHSYSKIFHVGHPSARPLFTQRVHVEEKVDGSQFSMLRLENGETVIKSKMVEMDPYNPNGMFKLAAETALALDLHPGWIYRGEFLQKPKHNTLNYARVPKKNVIIFDIEKQLYTFLSLEEKQAEAARLGLEVVPVLFEGILEDPEQFNQLLDSLSVLGNEKIEGVVIKPAEYNLFGDDSKVIMAKYVREDFKERNGENWKVNVNPGKNEILERIIARYSTVSGRKKAVQRLREADKLTNSPKDIGAIIPLVQEDIATEWAAEIKEMLFKWALPKIQKGVCREVPDWYKRELMSQAFEPIESNEEEQENAA